MDDFTKLISYKTLTENFLGELPFLGGIGPDGWSASGFNREPLYALEIDTVKKPASKLAKAMPDFLHNAETALGGEVKVGYKNSTGFAIWFDERGYPPVDIVATLATEQFVFIKGQPGAGKTQLINQLVDAKEATQTIVFYPKASAHTINPIATIIGANGDYEAIATGLEDWLIKAHSPLPLTHIICDDWMLVLRFLPKLANMPFDLAMAGRENNLHITMVVHNDTVEALQIKGNGDMRRAFVTADLFKTTGPNPKRFGYLLHYDGRKEYFDHPGIWQQAIKLPESNQLNLTEAEWVLGKAAIKLNGGNCGVKQMTAIIRDKAGLPERFWREKGLLTRWQIQLIIDKWDNEGYLVPRPDVTIQHRLTAEFVAELQKIKFSQ